MKCPECEGATKVVDSRPKHITYRRRKCTSCNHRFSTYEVTQFTLLDILDEHFDVELVDKVADVLEKEFPEDTRFARL